MTSTAIKSAIDLFSAANFEYFQEQELYVDITEHSLVPPHIVVSDEDKKALLNKYKIKDYQLPKIRQDDAVARLMGLRVGQIVKIVRNSETAGRYVTYRLTV